MTKQEIIEIVQSMDHQSDFKIFYQFAHSYLLHMRIKGITDPDVFWNVIRHCQKTAENPNTIKAVGFSGKGRSAELKRWCVYLLNQKDLAAAGTDDLCSIFGYCSHLGK